MLRSIRAGALVVGFGLMAAMFATSAASADTADPTVSAQIRQSAGDFVPLPPARILDTRFGIGAPVGKVEALGSVTLQVTGSGGVPAGAIGVFVNLTVTESTFGGAVTAHSTAINFDQEDIADVVFFERGQTVSNMAFLAMASDGKLDVLLGSDEQGDAHIVMDVMGYVATSAGADASRMVSVAPSRILDTRDGNGLPGALGAGKTVAANGTGSLQVKGRGGVPNNATAVLLNLTGVTPTANTYVTAYPGDQATPPNASNLNMVPGQIEPNVVIVKLPADGTVKLFNYDGSIHLVADVIGYFVPSATMAGDTGKIVPQDPRVQYFDEGSPFDVLGPNSSVTHEYVDYQTIVEGQSVAGFLLNVSALSDQAGYLTVYPGSGTRPTASNLNLAPDVVTANLVPVAAGPGASVSYYNFSGLTLFSVAIVGYVLP